MAPDLGSAKKVPLTCVIEPVSIMKARVKVVVLDALGKRLALKAPAASPHRFVQKPLFAKNLGNESVSSNRLLRMNRTTPPNCKVCFPRTQVMSSFSS